MGRPSVVTTIQLTGPFFTHDPRKTFRQNVRVMMEAIAEEGEADVIAKMRVGQGSRAPVRGITPNRVAGHVKGRVASLRGKPWEVTAVVSVQNTGFTQAQAISLMAAASRVETDTKAFRRMARQMRKAKALNRVELLKGLQ